MVSHVGCNRVLSWERPPPESYLILGPGRTCSNIVCFTNYICQRSSFAGATTENLLCRSKYFATRQNFKGHLPVSALGRLQFDYCLFCCYVVSLISSPFRRLRQAVHIAEGKARRQHRELHALLFSTSVWDL